MKYSRLILFSIMILSMVSLASAATAPYWIEEDLSRVWIKAPALSNSATTYYYVEKGTGSPRMSSVMIFGDDFETGTLNATKWSSSGTPTFSNGIITITASGSTEYIKSTSGGTGDIAMECFGSFYANAIPKQIYAGLTSNEHKLYFYNTNTINGFYFVKTTSYQTNVATNLPEGSYKKLAITRLSSSSPAVATWTYNGTHGTNSPYSSATYVTTYSPLLLWFETYDTATISMDYVFLRKHAATMPTVTVEDYDTFYIVKIDSTSSLTDFQVPITASQLEVTGYTDAMTFTSITAEQYTELTNPVHYPATPTTSASSQGVFWAIHNWEAASGDAITDSFCVQKGGVWVYNGTNTFYNDTSLTAHATSTLSIYSYNNSNGVLSEAPLSSSVSLTNNPITILDVDSNANLVYGNTVNVNVGASDLDMDTATYSCNRTDLFTDFSTSTGIGSWTTSQDDLGEHIVLFTVTDGHGSSDSASMNIMVSDYIYPNIISKHNDFTNDSSSSFNTTEGNNITFSINASFASSYNWKVNNISQSLNSNTFEFDTTGYLNLTNVTGLAFNGNGTDSETWLFNLTEGNDAPVFVDLTGVTVNEGATISFTVVATDTENDTLDYGIFDKPEDATFNDEEFYWETGTSDSGSYPVIFTVTDGNSVTTKVITIRVNDITTGGGSVSGGGSSTTSTQAGGYSGKDIDPSSNTYASEKISIKDLDTDTSGVVTFASPAKHDIISATFTPSMEESTVGITVQKLRGNSIYTESDPDADLIYSYVNVLVEDEQYSQKVDDALIRFRVNSEWLESNNATEIVLYEYIDGSWEPCTTALRSSTTSYNVYESEVEEFGHYSICAYENTLFTEYSGASRPKYLMSMTDFKEGVINAISSLFNGIISGLTHVF